MKKQFVSGAIIAGLAFSVVACSNDATDTASNDTTTSSSSTTANVETTTTSSSGDYAAMADSVERNSRQGYYLNPKTGKPYGSLKVDRSTGRVTTEAGEPVWRYVDNRNWWVYGYGDNNWEQVGEAQMEGDRLMYKGDGDKWVDYDTRWSKADEDNVKKYKVSDDGNKQKIVTEDGDKIKVKTDEEGNTKVKVNGEKVKVDKDGKVKND